VLQQSVLVSMLLGGSRHQASRAAKVDRRTVGRWWDWLESRQELFAFRLRSRFPDWGRVSGWKDFWLNCLNKLPLAEIMAWLDLEVCVP
jgi:hypothetical protein